MLSKPLASPDAGNVVYSGMPLAPMSDQPAYCSGAPKMPKMLSSAISSSALTWVLPTSSSSDAADHHLPPVHAAETVLVVEERLHAPLEALEQAVAERVRRSGAEHGEVDRFVGHAGHSLDRLERADVRLGVGRLGIRRLGVRRGVRRRLVRLVSAVVSAGWCRRWLPPWSRCRSARPSCRTIRRRHPSCRTRREPGHPRPIPRTNGVSLPDPVERLRSIKFPLVEKVGSPIWHRTVAENSALPL